MSEWFPITDVLPEPGEPILLHNPEWIDGDFNPYGVREGFYNDGENEWTSAFWNGYQDFYDTVFDVPTHWTFQPRPPVTNKER